MRKSLLVLAMIGCTPIAYDPATQQASYAKAKANADAQVDSVMLGRIQRARASAKSTGGSSEAWIFAKEVENAYHSKMVERGKVDGPALVTEAVGYLDAALEQDKMLAAKGSLLIT